MADRGTDSNWIARFSAERLVRYEELRPCTTAFIDTRTPGSSEKENFTIIGPGVAENPEQHVHVEIPHGFNIGGARQPPQCVNSQHSHDTAEVFVVHSGTWAFLLGPNQEDGSVTLHPGDVISIPTHVFRGFKNVGQTRGFLYAVLGGDDPGHVTWAPYVFDEASKHGLVLLEDGSLVDTKRGETIPEGKRPMPPTTKEDVARLRRMTAEELQSCVATRDQLEAYAASTVSAQGLIEVPVIGTANPAEQLEAGRMDWPHGFNLRYLTLPPGAESATHSRAEEEVIFVQQGSLAVDLPGGELVINRGDTLTMPIGMERKFANRGDEAAELYVVRGGDHPQAAQVAA